MVENETKTDATTKNVQALKTAFPQAEFDKMLDLLPFSGIGFTLQKEPRPDPWAEKLRQGLECWEFSPKCGMVRVIDGLIGTAETVLRILSGQIACDVDNVHENSRDNIEDSMGAWQAMADAALREVACARKKLARDGLILLTAQQKGESKSPATPVDADEDQPLSEPGERTKLEVGMRVEARKEGEYVDGVVVEVCEYGCWVREDGGEVFASQFGKMLIYPQQPATEAA